MRFSVSVPVLSTASTVALPRLSTAAGQRASTPIRAKRSAPRARNKANTTGISLGSSARARARAASSASGQLPPMPPWPTASRAHSPRASSVKREVSRRVWRWSRVGGGVTVARLRPICPNSVASARAFTSAQPRPLATSEPARIQSPPCLATGSDSPVSSDSSSHRPTVSVRLASAATRSPSSSRSKSPKRSCSAAIARSTPARRTWARGADRRASSARARLLRCCWMASSRLMPTTKASRIAASACSPISP